MMHRFVYATRQQLKARYTAMENVMIQGHGEEVVEGSCACCSDGRFPSVSTPGQLFRVLASKLFEGVRLRVGDRIRTLHLLCSRIR